MVVSITTVSRCAVDGITIISLLKTKASAAFYYSFRCTLMVLTLLAKSHVYHTTNTTSNHVPTDCHCFVPTLSRAVRGGSPTRPTCIMSQYHGLFHVVCPVNIFFAFCDLLDLRIVLAVCIYICMIHTGVGMPPNSRLVRDPARAHRVGPVNVLKEGQAQDHVHRDGQPEMAESSRARHS